MKIRNACSGVIFQKELTSKTKRKKKYRQWLTNSTTYQEKQEATKHLMNYLQVS